MRQPLERLQRSPAHGIGHAVRGVLLVCWFVYSGVACGGSAPMRSSDATRAVATSSALPTSTSSSVSDAATKLVAANVVRVVDGDTIIVELNGDEQRVRLIGINTPELNKPDGPIECFATEATTQTESLVDRARGNVQLERDVSETDQYGRLLRYVWLLNPDGRQMLNEELVEGGYAKAITYRPDVKYQSILKREQSDAIDQHLGLWKACD